MRNTASRAETSSAILAMATRMLADRPDVTVAEIAAASGVGRATVYRYFPTREAVMQALEADALEELAARITESGRDDAPVPQVVERLLRAFLEMSDQYVVLTRQRALSAAQDDAADVERLVWTPFRAVFQRGVEDGTFRRGLDPEILSRSFAGLALAAVDAGLPRTIGIDQTTDLVASLFLNGAARRSKSKPKSRSKRAA